MTFLLNLLAVLVVGLPVSLTSQENLPNPNCTISNGLRCDNVNIPGNFSVGLIPVNVAAIELGSACLSATNGVYCNVLEDGAKPFPSNLVSLKTVYFKGFRSSKQGDDFKFNVLLNGVKDKLRKLSIFNCKIERIEAKCFKGYRSLRELSISSGVRDISPDAFLEITDTGASPSLLKLDMFNNALASFDWSVLRPISASLREIHLDKQHPGLQRVFRSSSSFSLLSLNMVLLGRNNLTTLAKDVLETIPGADRTTLVLAQNNFCPENPDCSCCALKDMAQWAISQQQKPARFSVVLGEACGTVNRIKTLFWDPSIGLPEKVAHLPRDC